MAGFHREHPLRNLADDDKRPTSTGAITRVTAANGLSLAALEPASSKKEGLRKTSRKSLHIWVKLGCLLPLNERAMGRCRFPGS